MSLYFNKQTNEKIAYFLIAFTDVRELSKSKQVPDLRIGAWIKVTKQNKLGKKRIGTQKVNDAWMDTYIKWFIFNMILS